MGRPKVKLERIEDKTQQIITFSKRRKELFQKAEELSILCDAEVGVLVFSPGKKPFTFGQPSFDSVAERYLALQKEENRRDKVEAEEGSHRDKVEAELAKKWWLDTKVEDLGLNELEEYTVALQELKNNVSSKADEIATSKATPYNFI
ncbi:hypothetical protein RJ640_019026 [Escallonia rubra]|uniref:MADS-box domain-containing protein n=1 Tax=Escallonia rubra TaxID=112253 RepID=A0AA88U959_9ASTE|nr:hypothetical protein RJ640_019026 [Escallonia rubra]